MTMEKQAFYNKLFKFYEYSLFIKYLITIKESYANGRVNGLGGTLNF
jgi:hypothetical protein